LKILTDKEGKRLKEYHVEVVNDELIITDEDGDLFEYFPGSLESQRVQETLFHEKQTIIENCLFGVDINPNSVKICRLRLWIELLKNAYYKTESNFTELETLPNIDINIKCGNSLISRYALDADIRQALKSSKWSINSYRMAVMSYRNASGKEQKREMERLIESIKNEFETDVAANDKRLLQVKKLNGDLFTLTNQTTLFDRSKKEMANWNKKVNELTAKIQKIETELEQIKSHKIYENAFEWRFEFPEVLNDEGDFVGFDVVIGNPPYGVKFNSNEKTLFSVQYSTNDDIYSIFIERGLYVSKVSGNLSFITPIFWLTGDNYLSTRMLVLDKGHLETGIILPYNIFADAYIDTGIFLFSKDKNARISKVYEFDPKDKVDSYILNSLPFNQLITEDWGDSMDLKIVFNPVSRSLTKKLMNFEKKFSDVTESIRGILADQEDYSESQVDNEYKLIFTGKLGRYYIDNEFQYLKYGENLKEKPSSFQFFEGERLLIRRIVNRQFRIMATIVTDTFVNKKDIYVFKLCSNEAEINCKYLLSILNSKLISFIKTKGSTTAKKDDFTQLTLNDIRQLGIPFPTHQQRLIIDGLVDRILSAKQSDPTADTSVLEKEIDQLVYELYVLTEEEIKIVEGK
jgi:adenine-specific DNA-methyltransferase